MIEQISSYPCKTDTQRHLNFLGCSASHCRDRYRRQGRNSGIPVASRVIIGYGARAFVAVGN
jgi:hypothetical protein